MSGEVGGAGGSYSYDALKRLDQLWSGICSAQTGIPVCLALFSFSFSNFCFTNCFLEEV